MKATLAALCAAALAMLGCETPSPIEMAGPSEPVALAESEAEVDTELSQAYEVPVNRVVEYLLTTEGIERVVRYLRENEQVRRALADSGSVRIKLRPIIELLRDQGALQQVPVSDDARLTMLFEDQSAASVGLVRLWEQDGEGRLQVFEPVSPEEGGR